MINVTIRTRQLLCFLITICIAACSEQAPTHSQISEQPPEANQTALINTTYDSRLSTRIKIAYDDLIALVEEAVPAIHKGNGKQKTCKRVIGIKLCGSALWNYTVVRNGDVEISGQDDIINLSFPLAFFGQAGISGDLAKVLKLDKLDFNGAMLTTLQLKLDFSTDWCPIVTSQVAYKWTESPELQWNDRFELDIKDKVDDAIKKQIQRLQARVEKSIDCDQVRRSIQAQWKQHSIGLDLVGNEKMHLNISPTSFAFSGIKTESNHLGLAFTLNAQTSIQNTPLATATLALPALTFSPYELGKTEFNLLIRASYEQLESLAANKVVGNTFTEMSPAGEISVTIDELKLSGNPSGITINLGFRAQLPTQKKLTVGNVYLTATPVLNAFSQRIQLENITLTNVLDSALWNTLATVFNKKIISELQKNAVYELGPQLAKLSIQIEDQLNDPARTGGLSIAASKIDIALLELVPEQNNLAALLQVGTLLDINVPLLQVYEQQTGKRTEK